VCLEQAGEQGKLLFDAYPRLKQINRARKNLEKTLTEVRSVLQHRCVYMSVRGTLRTGSRERWMLITAIMSSVVMIVQVNYYANLTTEVTWLVEKLEKQPLKIKEVGGYPPPPSHAPCP
jgi:hypothetical protein